MPTGLCRVLHECILLEFREVRRVLVGTRWLLRGFSVPRVCGSSCRLPGPQEQAWHLFLCLFTLLNFSKRCLRCC